MINDHINRILHQHILESQDKIDELRHSIRRAMTNATPDQRSEFIMMLNTMLSDPKLNILAQLLLEDFEGPTL